MRRLIITLMCLLPVSVGAQDFIRYTPPSGIATTGGGLAFDSICLDKTNQDVCLERDAANTLALRNSTSAQTFNIYNTYTDASNYEVGYLKWDSNVFELETNNAGTGGNRSIRLKAASGAIVIESNMSPTGGGNVYTLGLGADANNMWHELYLKAAIQGSKSKALADETAVDIVLIAIPDGEHAAGKVKYSVHDATSDDATYYEISFACVNNADTEACTVSEDVETQVGTDGDTIDCTAAIDVDETNAVMFKTTCNQEGDDNAMTGYFRFDITDPQTMTWQ